MRPWNRSKETWQQLQAQKELKTAALRQHQEDAIASIYFRQHSA